MSFRIVRLLLLLGCALALSAGQGMAGATPDYRISGGALVSAGGVSAGGPYRLTGALGRLEPGEAVSAGGAYRMAGSLSAPFAEHWIFLPIITH